MNSNYDALEKAITQFINDDALKDKAYTLSLSASSLIN
jgi:hypothetical protein